MGADPPFRKDNQAARAPLPLNAVPAPAVRRLSLYLRQLEGFHKQDRETISSKQLGESLGYTDAQVRKDLAYFGQFGHPGIGYRVDELIARIRCILGTDRTWNAVVVGAGNLGQALVSYRGFAKKGFQIVGVFDDDPAKVGEPAGVLPGMTVLPLSRLPEVIEKTHAQIGIITVPAEVAQVIADMLVAAGIRSILNFAPASLVVPEEIPVATVELASHLEQLAFRINLKEASASE